MATWQVLCVIFVLVLILGVTITEFERHLNALRAELLNAIEESKRQLREDIRGFNGCRFSTPEERAESEKSSIKTRALLDDMRLRIERRDANRDSTP